MNFLNQKLFWLTAIVCLMASSSLSFAQSEEDELDDLEVPKPIPIGVAMFSSVERGFKEMDYIFETIEHPELSDLVSINLANLGDLKGVDRNRPFGLVFFLKPGTGFNIFPTPAFAAFLPCENFDDLLATFGTTGMQVAKLPEYEYRYTMQGPGQTFQLEQFDEYVFITNDETLLDGEMPNPDSLTKTLATRYDVAAQVNIKNVPVGMRKILLDFLRAKMEAEMQQRDEEPEGAWRARKASTANNLHFIEQLATQGDSITVGLDVSKELRKAVVEVDLNAKPGSQFAKYLGDSGGVTSYYRALQSDPAIISAYMSWQMQDEYAKNLKEIAVGIKQLIEEEQSVDDLDDSAPVSPADDILVRTDGLFNCLADTAEAGTLDAFGRMQQTANGTSVVLASVRVINGTTASVTISDLLEKMKARDGDNVDLQLNAETYRGVTFHRVTPSNRDAGSQRVFGEDWSFYFGAGERTLWFLMGDEEVLIAVHDAIDKILDPASQQALPDAAPFRFTLNMSQWLAMFENPDREPGEFRQKVNETFEAGDDRIVADMTPKENGLRYRIRFEEGFVKIVGLFAARSFGIPLDE
ncbi:MAG: hypothetical protein HUJ26_13955 [Planctomycetaceae bacterium]|nr:hypothetical protein [Planctomycetaceae bacterium]